MKKLDQYKLLWVLFLTVITLSACKKVVDVKNFTAVDQDLAWGNQVAMTLLVNNIYATAEPDNFGRDYANAPHAFRYLQGIITDEARPATTFVGRTNAINNGVSFRPESAPFQSWNYGTIRLCNEFLEGIEKFYPLPNGSDQALVDFRNNLIGQVKFFRAFSYWRMVQIYGGVPIVDKVLDTKSPELYAPRNTLEESFQFIMADLKSAAALLPLQAGAGNRGRITKGAAMGLLSRVLLHRASPMYSPASNPQYWQEAADAAKAVLDLSEYSIEGVAFGQWFFEKDNKETIWQVEYVKGRKEHGFDAGNMSFVPLAREDVGGHCPTQELVDAFPMINGKAITDETSGYNPNDPFVNRDPRLKATVITNGDKYGVDDTGQPVVLYSFMSEGEDVAGNNKFNPNGYTKLYSPSTGYWLRKAMDERLVSNAALREYGYGRGSYSNWVEMRLGEIMLNYAEAENELGRTAAAYEMIGRLRERAGINPAGNYGLPAGVTTETMRAIIQNERFIELAFENKRYWDLKRWRLAEVVLNRPTHAVVITKKDNTPKTPNGTDYTYKYIVNMHDAAFPPVFQEKFYFLPLPQAQLLLNPELEQNPLWK